jgi:hypothetical protein
VDLAGGHNGYQFYAVFEDRLGSPLLGGPAKVGDFSPVENMVAGT